MDENYIDLVIDNTIINSYGPPENITPLNLRHSMLHVASSEVDMCDLNKYPYHFFPTLFTLSSTASLEKSGVLQVQRNPNFSLYGQGVLVGVIDTGIDYLHQAFRQSDGTTRIASLWDQTINNDNYVPSNEILYGTEYTKALINEALSSDNPLEIVPSTDDNGHGTMIAGIIAGSENIQEDFSGVVPSSEFVIVKLKPAKMRNRQIFAVKNSVLCYQDTDIIAGINYIHNVSIKLQQPLVICIAVGSNQGGHDGLDPLSRYLNTICQLPHVCALIAAGNEGNTQRHYYGTIEGGEQNYNSFQLNVSAQDTLFSFELWQAAPYRLSISITSPSGETVSDIYPRLKECRRLNFIFETTIIWVNNIISESESGDQVILVRFSKPLEGVWNFRVTNIDNASSTFHVWLPSGNIISNETFFLASSPDTTVLSPGNSRYPLTITAFNQESNTILQSSSRGYTRLDIVKPDVAAPGFNLTCPIIGNQYGSITGTGAAAAHATGIAAMVLEWAVVKQNFPSVTGTDVASLIIRGAKTSNNITYPNQIWGYGEISIIGLFENLV